MNNNPFVGVGFHAVGGVAHGSFYAPLKNVRKWAWETAWLVQGFAAWIIMPWFVAAVSASHPLITLSQAPFRSVLLTVLFGAMWGAGSLTFGLSMRYLGMSLGQAVALGYTVSLGTLVPPLFKGDFVTLLNTTGGRWVLAGVFTCLFGIALCGLAGIRREKIKSESLHNGQRVSLVLGFAVATFSGVMSSGFAFGIQSGRPIATAALQNGAPTLFQNSTVFVAIMAGGFVVNAVWCLFLSLRNGSTRDFFGKNQRCNRNWTGLSPEEWATSSGSLPRNYFWASISGTTWYAGFMLYGMGTTFMGRYDFTSWAIHLAFVIVFSTLCGILAREWRGVGRTTGWLVACALLTLVASTAIIAFGNRLSTPAVVHPVVTSSK